MKYKIMGLAATVALLVGLLIGCSGTTDYTDYFCIQSIAPVDDQAQSQIEVTYSIENLGKKDNLVFSVTINGESKPYSVMPGEVLEDSMIIDIGRPDSYQLEYPVQYEVKRNEKSLWTKDDTISYDCTGMFFHQAIINYGSESVPITITDFQVNYFDLTELFPNFDSSVPHNTNITDDGDSDASIYAEIQENRDEDNGSYRAATGGILRLANYGTEKACDTYHFPDGIVIDITDSVSASSVNWADYVTFSDEVDVSNNFAYMAIDLGINPSAISIMTFYAYVENPSDETIYGSITDFYLNDTPIPKDSLNVNSDVEIYGGKGIDIRAGETRELWSKITPVIAGSIVNGADIDKFGMTIVLKDEDGNTLYEDTLWQS